MARLKTSITIGIITVLIGTVVAFVVVYNLANSKSINLVQNNWLHFPGAQVSNNGIHFMPLNRSIVHQDGSQGQPNPPVNLAGQHLLVRGNFNINAVLSKIDKQASLRFYVSPPIIYDQWRHETPSIEIIIDVAKNSITANIWDGTSNTSMDMREYHVSLPAKIDISLERQSGQINIIENNNVLGSMPDHHIFDSGEVWFGADSFGSSGWTLASLGAHGIENGSVKIVFASLLIADQSDKVSLRNLANANSRKLKIGAAISLEPLFADLQYRALALSQFSIITPENSLKPQFIHPQLSVYDFSEADQLVGAALENNITVHGHTLLYGKSSPDWMTQSPLADRQKIEIDHIKTVVSHFKEKIAEWDVVNESLSDKNALYKNWGSGLEPNIWFELMGEKYIDLAFITAHDADPSAKLYINDYGLENDGQRWDAIFRLVKRLKQRGVPIDGVGFEAHVYNDGDYINADQLKKHMQALAELGLLARISEIDVTGDDPTQQVNQYVTALDVCLGAPNCTSYTTWGITDLYGSTTRSDRYPLVYGTSLLWDKDFKIKPAYSALQKRLQQTP